MAKCFTTWTVLKHDPFEKHSENLWSLSGYMPRGNQRRMTLARRADGALVIHNPIALEEEGMKELEAFGKPTYIVVPNAFHRQDAFIYKQRYPQAIVLCPEGARKKISDVVEVSGHLDEMPKDSLVELFHLRGVKQREGALRVKANGGVALVFNDVLLNMEPTKGVMGFLLGPTGTLSVPRVTRWIMTQSTAELKHHLEELANAGELTHLVPGHGKVVDAQVKACLQQAIARLS